MSRWLVIAINVVSFDALWTAAMFGAGKSWWWAAPVLIVLSMAVQLWFYTSPGREVYLILAGAAVGTGLDWLAVTLGVFRYASESRAEFLVLFCSLWINFGTTLRPSLRWMWRRPALAAALGLIGGPVAYWVGARIGAISLSGAEWRGLAWVAAQYGIALPVWMVVADRVIGARDGTGPRSSARGATR
jgi:hypothetical protein